MAVVLLSSALSRSSTTVAHAISGRADPVVVIGTTATRSGVLTWRCGSLAEAEAWAAARTDVIATLSAAEHPDLDGMQFVASGWSVSQWERTAGGWVWDVSADVVEVLVP